MVDKFYQGMKFDFCNSVLSRNGKDEKGNIIKDFPDFNSLLGRKFSESVLFYDLMHKCFDGNYEIIMSGDELKPFLIVKENLIFILEKETMHSFLNTKI